MARIASTMTSSSRAAIEEKRRIRARAAANRHQQPDKDAVSGLICEKFAAMAEYAAAGTALFYVDFGDEVRTRPLVQAAMEEGKDVAVPYCEGDTLKLFRLKSFDELAPDTWNILEPKIELRARADRRVRVGELDLVMVPGVAFDRSGGRLGHGKGYYDKLLAGAQPETRLVAVAFECQLFPQIPMLPHDVSMDKVITEVAVYQAGARQARNPRR